MARMQELSKMESMDGRQERQHNHMLKHKDIVVGLGEGGEYGIIGVARPKAGANLGGVMAPLQSCKIISPTSMLRSSSSSSVGTY